MRMLTVKIEVDSTKLNGAIEKANHRSEAAKGSLYSRGSPVLMECLPYDKMGMSIRLMLDTGMRTQELLTLEPRHIEPDGSVLHIQQAVNLVKGSVHVGVLKSRDSYRDIPVPPNLHRCAQDLRNVDTKFI